MHSPERMTLAFVDTAVKHGAVALNYAPVERFLLDKERVVGVEATDPRAGAIELRGRLVINSAGPWIRNLNERLGARRADTIVTGHSKGAHIVTRPLTREHAVALPTRRRNRSLIGRGGRHVFIIPWRGRSLIGTTYGPYTGDLDAIEPTREDVRELVTDINEALEAPALSESDVCFAYAGLYPRTGDASDPDVYPASGDYRVVDHGRTDGIDGLVSVFGARYTTARRLAERAVDLAAARLGGGFGPCRTRTMPLAAGDIDDLEQFRDERRKTLSTTLQPATIDHLVTNYGRGVDAVAALALERPELARPLAEGRETIAAEALHAARSEMVFRLEDFVFRRSGLGTLGHPGRDALKRAAALIGDELGWDDTQRSAEIDRVEERFEP